MNFSSDQKEIIVKTLGHYSDEQLNVINKGLEMHMNPHVLLLVPRLGFNEYMVTPNHTHPSYMFLYNVDCRGKFFMEGKEQEIPTSASAIAALAPNIKHHEFMEGNYCSFVAIYIEKEYFENELKKYNLDPDFSFKFMYFESDPTLLNFLKLFMMENINNAEGKDEILDSLGLQITHILIRNLLHVSVRTSQVESKYQMDKLISYLYKNKNRKITLEEMAKFVNLSSSHFSKVFKETTGYPPMEYLKNLRLEEAKRMLAMTRKSLTEIALECGFYSPAYFSHLFQEKYEMTPSRFRKNFINKSS